MRTTAVVLLVAVLTVIAFSDVIKDGSFQAISDGSTITLRWMVNSEANVAGYGIQKRTGTTGDFATIATITPRGQSLYEFVDYSGMDKVSSLYQYRIFVSFADRMTPLYVGPVTVSQSVSGVRKTWGSIKALFR